MNSWEIIRSKLVIDTSPGTIGRHVQINKCGNLFIALRHLLTDEKIATDALNADPEVKESIVASRGIKELQDAGVLKRC